MITRDLHTHTVFSDGANTPEDMVLSAIEKGVSVLGISDHSPTAFDPSYCLSPDQIAAYVAEIAALKETYRDRLTLLCGIEQDYFSAEPTQSFDFIIGSVHYVKAGDTYIPVDSNAAILREAADTYFGGDIYAFVEEYYRLVGDVVEKTHPTLIGHFDLITKFSEQETLFDTAHPRYVAAWQAAADRLLAANIPFEINTGAISRGYRTTPYPAKEICSYLKERGATLWLSSDSHAADKIGFRFDTFASWAE